LYTVTDYYYQTTQMKEEGQGSSGLGN
jgi:hypothetical protein